MTAVAPLTPAPTGLSWSPEPPTTHAGIAVDPGRYVLRIPGHSWEVTPAECADPGTGVWIAARGRAITAGFTGDEALVCPGCGLDVT
ncbi:hypothetical protein ACFY0R_37860 [Streptomyces sp. NPDC001633]|uniref:hypothetical protein n=1 Tax=Streptomyces sp. NPDC001633 TaxID=3364595 RepID=UPI0036ADCECB